MVEERPRGVSATPAPHGSIAHLAAMLAPTAGFGAFVYHRGAGGRSGTWDEEGAGLGEEEPAPLLVGSATQWAVWCPKKQGSVHVDRIDSVRTEEGDVDNFAIGSLNTVFEELSNS